METGRAKKLGIRLMENAEAVYLTTVHSDGLPYTRAVFNLRNTKQYPGLVEFFSSGTEDFSVYVSTNTSSEKVNQILANPLVSAYYCVPGEFHSLMLSGRMEIVKDAEIKEKLWQKGWEIYYPAGTGDPDYSILCLKPVIARGWYREGPFEFELKGGEV